MRLAIHARRAALAAGVAVLAMPAAAAVFDITITNDAGPGGFSVTPLWAAFHDSGFDAFDVGDTASPGIEQIAEVGVTGMIGPEFAAADPDGTATTLPSNGGPPPFQPGQSATTRVNVASTGEVFFSFASMLVPSNDTFLGNDDAPRTVHASQADELERLRWELERAQGLLEQKRSYLGKGLTRTQAERELKRFAAALPEDADWAVFDLRALRPIFHSRANAEGREALAELAGAPERLLGED